MTNFVIAINRKYLDILARKALRQIIKRIYESPREKYMCSAFIFNGYLIDLILEDNVFHVYLVSDYHLWTLYCQTTSYSLTNFIKYTREWLKAALTAEPSLSNPCYFAKAFKISKFKNFSSKHSLTMLQTSAIDDYITKISFF